MKTLLRGSGGGAARWGGCGVDGGWRRGSRRGEGEGGEERARAIYFYQDGVVLGLWGRVGLGGVAWPWGRGCMRCSHSPDGCCLVLTSFLRPWISPLSFRPGGFTPSVKGGEGD